MEKEGMIASAFGCKVCGLNKAGDDIAIRKGAKGTWVQC